MQYMRTQDSPFNFYRYFTYMLAFHWLILSAKFEGYFDILFSRFLFIFEFERGVWLVWGLRFFVILPVNLMLEEELRENFLRIGIN